MNLKMCKLQYQHCKAIVKRFHCWPFNRNQKTCGVKPSHIRFEIVEILCISKFHLKKIQIERVSLNRRRKLEVVSCFLKYESNIKITRCQFGFRDTKSECNISWFLKTILWYKSEDFQSEEIKICFLFFCNFSKK